jgi:hypothetical protein
MADPRSADPWKRYRLLACIAVMAGMLTVGLISYQTVNPAAVRSSHSRRTNGSSSARA